MAWMFLHIHSDIINIFEHEIGISSVSSTMAILNLDIFIFNELNIFISNYVCSRDYDNAKTTMNELSIN